MLHIRRAVIACVLVALSGVLVASTAGASRPAATPPQGVTKDAISVVVLVSDLDGLRAAGSPLPAKLTTAYQVNGFQMHFDELGPVNGRKVVVTPVTWDPTKVTTFDTACTKATQDIKPFAILNVAGWRPQLVPCITVDNKTPLIMRDPVQSDMYTASGNRLLTLMPPSDVMGTATADLVAKHNMVPKTAKVGLMTSNDPGGVAAGDALEAGLKKNGYNVVNRVVINALSSDTTALNRETATAVGTFKAAGVDTVFSGVQVSQEQGFFQENTRSGAGLKLFIVDDAPSMCSSTTARSMPADQAGTPCLTATGVKAVAAKNALQPDTKFEAQCRTTWDAAMNEKSQPGVPAGDLTAGGVTYTEDMSPDNCTMVHMFWDALKKAGKNPTWDKVAKAFEGMTSLPMVLMSNGEGGFAKGKPYAAKNVHVVTLNPATSTTAKDPTTGLFNGCPAPVSCFIPLPTNGQDWFPLKAKAIKSKSS